jgi:hypothetical protein
VSASPSDIRLAVDQDSKVQIDADQMKYGEKGVQLLIQ